MLWRRAAAVAPIRPLAWELIYAAGAAVKSKGKKKERKKERKINKLRVYLFLFYIEYNTNSAFNLTNRYCCELRG